MIRTKTLFIIGAGASCELGFPSGPELLKRIATALDIRFPSGLQQTSGSPAIMNQYRLIHRRDDPTGNINDYLHAGWRMRDAAEFGRSIDNVIDQNDQDARIALAGKLAIALEILSAERRSKLYVGPDSYPETINTSAIQDTWLVPFSQILTTDVRRSSIERMLENIMIISFNYDRSIEQFIPAAIMQSYGLARIEAEAIAKELKIIHPYGWLGGLPWMGSETKPVSFGSESGQLEELSQELLTFSEQQNDSSLIDNIHGMMTAAERIVFLGFGFHRQNLELLTPKNFISAKNVISTAYKEPIPTTQMAENFLTKLAPEPKNQFQPTVLIELIPQTCAVLLRQHYSVLTS